MNIDLNIWEIIIGLEVHAQISSSSKLFSSSSTKFGAEPNSQVSLIDAALPGVLPRVNNFCIEQAIKTGLGIQATINHKSIFDRKNYFYPDLPQGYQITQFYQPIVQNGILNIKNEEGKHKDIRINRIHLEQDAGKSIHDQSPNYTYIDLNRSGIALMEIVTEPDLRSSFEASEYMKKLRQILRYLGTCDGDMEKGSLRCDANVSVRKRGEQKLGTRCEIKNLNSIRNVMRAIDYEAERQIAIINNGGVIDQETRLYDVNKDETRTMRSKEDAFDYRYFPDPDLLTVEIDDTLINRIKASMPELPEQKLQHYITEFKISEYDAEVLLAEQIVTKYFEEVASKSEPKLAANWITVELFAKLNKNDLSINESPVSADNLAKLIKLIMNNIISGKIAKEVFEKMFSEGRDAEEIVESEGLKQIIDENAISAMIEEILHNNSDKVAEYKSGKHKLFGFFVGQVMKASGGKVNPELANQILQQKLNG